MIFLDSNVLVYSVDERDERKHAIATSILDNALNDRDEYAIAVQTLAEFTKKDSLLIPSTERRIRAIACMI